VVNDRQVAASPDSSDVVGRQPRAFSANDTDSQLLGASKLRAWLCSISTGRRLVFDCLGQLAQ
jgi:hypothetical protein